MYHVVGYENMYIIYEYNSLFPKSDFHGISPIFSGFLRAILREIFENIIYEVVSCLFNFSYLSTFVLHTVLKLRMLYFYQVIVNFQLFCTLLDPFFDK